MALGQREVLAHYRENIALADDLIARWQQVAEDTKARLAAIEVELSAARVELGTAYLLELTAEALKRAEKLTGYRGFTRRDPLKAMQHERQVLERTIRQIEADDRYRRREYLVGPEGEHTRELAEAVGLLEPWEQECDRFESQAMFLELVEVKYDTDEFSGWWYQPKYWKYWAAGDRICESLGMSDFGDDVLPAYLKAREPREQWRAQVAAVEAKIDEVHELVRRRDQAEARIPQLPALYLESCRQQLAEFFQRADLGLLEEWLSEAGGDRGVQQVLRRCAGLGAKSIFLREMVEGIGAHQAELHARRTKFSRKVTKYSRSKYGYTRFTDAALDAKFQAKRDKYLAYPVKLQGQVDRLAEFDDYSSFDLDNDPELWWLFMVRKPPSRYTPRLRSWYERHPDAVPELEADDGLAQAVFVAASTLDSADRGYLS